MIWIMSHTVYIHVKKITEPGTVVRAYKQQLMQSWLELEIVIRAPLGQHSKTQCPKK